MSTTTTDRYPIWPEEIVVNYLWEKAFDFVNVMTYVTEILVTKTGETSKVKHLGSK